MRCPHLPPQTLSDCVWWVSGDGQLVGKTVAYFSNESVCLKLERGPFCLVRRPIQYEYCCCNFSFSYSIGLLLGLFLSFDLPVTLMEVIKHYRRHCSKAGVANPWHACQMRHTGRFYMAREAIPCASKFQAGKI